MASARNNRRHRRGRGRFGPLFKLLCAIAVVVALTMGATVFFQVETVVVSGNSRYTQEEVIAATGIQTGDNLFRMNKYQIARQVLQKLPYTRDILIRRGWPNTIIITMTEWDAVARVVAPTDTTAAVEEDSDGDSSGETLSAVATEDWLISVGGKLLEPASADSDVIQVSGITPLMPRAGTLLELPQKEQARKDALLALLSDLEELDMLEQVSYIRLESTQAVMGYMDRFDVKMPLNSDFDYKLRVLEAAVADAERKLGEQTAGTFDLTQEGYTAVYSPN